MEMQKEKIMRFSKIMYMLLKIAFIAMIVVCVFQGIAMMWANKDWPTDTVMVNGREMVVPVLLKIGGTRVALPITWESGTGFFNERRPFLDVRANDLAVNIVVVIGLGFVNSVFKKLRVNGSPFNVEVVKSLRVTSIALLVMGVGAGPTALTAAGIAWVICLIFEYGRALQDESDTTL